ncbi:MAG: ComF family protein [Oscillospiraceae bacterium]|jgi:ComF family protein|nr:ComF family protein [Oscillospiraceae bacterium]
MMNAKWKRRLEHILLWLFPRRCLLCEDVTEPGAMFCPDCSETSPPLLDDCLLPGTQIPLVSVLPYHSEARRILLDFKFHGARQNAQSIGRAMGEAVRHRLDKPEDWLFCCVPMTDAQLRERGYNQSALLAQSAAVWAGAECDVQLLIKTRETQAQHNLSAAEREQNITAAFAAREPDKLRAQKIVLCDDIATTGATLRACANALSAANIAEIICLTYLRTEKEGDYNSRDANRH